MSLELVQQNTPERLERIYVTLSFVALSGGVFLIFFENARYASEVQSNFLAQLLSVPAIMYGFFFGLVRASKVLGLVLRTPLPALLCLLCFLSVAWSIDPFGTFRRATILMGITAFAYALCVRFSATDLVRLMSAAFICLAGLTAAGAVLLPATAIHQDQHYPAVRGFFAQKNIAGRVFLLGFIVAVATARTRRRFMSIGSVAAALCLVGIVASLSATALVDLFIVLFALSAALVWRKLNRPSAFLVVGILILVLPISAHYFYSSLIPEIISSAGRDMTLTGRTYIWAELYAQVRAKSPLLGFGYEAFWTAGANGASDTNWTGLGPYIPPHAHNGFMHAYTAFGIVGPIVYMYALGKFLLVSIRNLSGSRGEQTLVGILGLMFFSFFLIINVTENEFLSYNSVIWCLFIVTMVYGESYGWPKGFSRK